LNGLFKELKGDPDPGVVAEFQALFLGVFLHGERQIAALYKDILMKGLDPGEVIELIAPVSPQTFD